MALSIGVSAGSKIKVGEHLVRVTEASPGRVTLRVDEGPAFIVSEIERTEILPGVFVFVGTSRNPDTGGQRLAFEAPYSIPINRVRPGSTARRAR